MIVMVLVLFTSPALAQQGEEGFCAIPEGCDLDGDGTSEVPAGTPLPADPNEQDVPSGDQYSVEGDPQQPGSVIVLHGQPNLDEIAPTRSSGDTSPTPKEGEPVVETAEPVLTEGTDEPSTTSMKTKSIKLLPDTGGISFPGLGIGVLLVAGGLLFKRIIR